MLPQSPSPYANEPEPSQREVADIVQVYSPPINYDEKVVPALIKDKEPDSFLEDVSLFVTTIQTDSQPGLYSAVIDFCRKRLKALLKMASALS